MCFRLFVKVSSVTPDANGYLKTVRTKKGRHPQSHGVKQLTLEQWEKEMISDMLQRTKTDHDLDANLEKMSCNLKRPSKQCLAVYHELALLRIKRFERS